MSNENGKTGRDIASARPSLAQLGAIFGTSGRWIGELRARGAMPPDGATLAENVAAFVAYRRSYNG